RCHGTEGRGDGPLIGEGPNMIANRPRDFTDPTTTQEQTPLEWFTIITEGQLDRLMPPWKDALSESERWAVALYTYTLHYTPEQLEAGQALWEAQGQTLDNLPPQERQVNLTDSALVAEMLPDATLSPEEQAALAAFLRAQTVENANFSAIGVVTTPEAEATQVVASSATINITGQVTNGTAGGVVPEGMTVTLHAFDPQFAETTTDTTLNEDGTFVFENVEIRSGWTYVATVTYQDRIFGREIIPGDPDLDALDLPITLYELTSDSSVIRIEGMVTQISAFENSLEIAQVISFANVSDRLYSTDEVFGEAQFGSVRVVLPPGAQILSVPDAQQRYVISSDGSTVIDTAPVLPGDGHIIHVIYSLPYNGDLTLEQPILYDVVGEVRFLTSPDSLTVGGDQVVPTGPQALGNNTYQSYAVSTSLQAGDTLRIQLRGGLGEEMGGSGINLLSIIMVVVGVGVLILSFILFQRERRRPKASPQLMDALILQIAELDAQHEAGEIADDVYQSRRAALKARLAEIMDKQGK